MRLKSCLVKNFGSYKELAFDFNDLALSLVYGKTGSGKSTLQDIPAWVLFGITAKDGNVDDIRSWQADGEPTKGILVIEPGFDSLITVIRIRGSASQNDLYWKEESSDEKIRGKDLADTQKLLEKRLGFSSDQYLTGAYFNDSSPTGSFFTAKARDRRAVFEKIATLDLAVQLAEKSSLHKKLLKQELEDLSAKHQKLCGRLTQRNYDIVEIEKSIEAWYDNQKTAISAAQGKFDNFERIKAANLSSIKRNIEEIEEYLVSKESYIDKGEYLKGQIEEVSPKYDLMHKKACTALNDLLQEKKCLIKEKNGLAVDATCSACGSVLDNTKAANRLQEINKSLLQLEKTKEKAQAKVVETETLLAEVEDLKKEYEKIKQEKSRYDLKAHDISHLEKQYESLDATQNNYLELLNKLKNEINPYTSQFAICESEIENLKAQIAGKAFELEHLNSKIANLSYLYDLSADLRGELLKKAVKEIELKTNEYLERYFDAELRVCFSLDSDKLEVAIQKSGYECSYKQLSKGQRGLLKLAFAVSIMQAASNKAGVHFDNLFFDEALDGLDTDLKVKAFGLFQELENGHESILLIDHAPEFQNLFTNKFHVVMESDVSQVQHED